MSLPLPLAVSVGSGACLALCRNPLSAVAAGALFLALATHVSLGNADEPKVKVDDSSFKCITEMTQVRHFFVDNLLGNLAATVAVATAGKGEYPEGSVLQIMPNE